MAYAENQVIEIKAVDQPGLLPGRREEKDVKNEGRSGNLYENKGLRKLLAGRSGYVDENKLVNWLAKR
jgi:hypothetical protein